MCIRDRDDRYRGFKGERRIVMMNRDDMQARGLKEETVVHIEGRREAAGRVAERFIVVPYDIPRGSVATYFPEANVLVPLEVRADRSHTPASKLVVVAIEKAPTQ